MRRTTKSERRHGIAPRNTPSAFADLLDIDTLAAIDQFTRCNAADIDAATREYRSAAYLNLRGQ